MTTRHVRHLRVAHILCTLLLNGAHTGFREGHHHRQVVIVGRQVQWREAPAIALVQHRVPLANHKRRMCVYVHLEMPSPPLPRKLSLDEHMLN